MSLWWIVAAALLGLCVVCVIAYAATYNTWIDLWWAIGVGVLCGVLGLLVLAGCALGTVGADKETHLFEQQKAFLESYEPADAMENAAITAKIVELNEWLYSAQYSVENWPEWTFYDEAVLDLEPIARK